MCVLSPHTYARICAHMQSAASKEGSILKAKNNNKNIKRMCGARQTEGHGTSWAYPARLFGIQRVKGCSKVCWPQIFCVTAPNVQRPTTNSTYVYLLAKRSSNNTTPLVVATLQMISHGGRWPSRLNSQLDTTTHIAEGKRRRFLLSQLLEMLEMLIRLQHWTPDNVL